MIQLVTLKIAFLENEISSAVSVQTCHSFWGICWDLLFLSFMMKLDDKIMHSQFWILLELVFCQYLKKPNLCS